MTAQLVQLYDKAGDDRKFEIVLFGYDRTPDAHVDYLKKAAIKFPAVKLDERKGLDLSELGDTGYIPNIVLVKPDGKMITNDRSKALAEITKLAGG